MGVDFEFELIFLTFYSQGIIRCHNITFYGYDERLLKKLEV